MRAYVLRRLLLMIPTFVGITLVLFAVLNFAPGRPGVQQQGDLAKNAKSEQSQESFRIFREQFALDKPVFFNTRFALRTEEVQSALRVAAGATPAASRDRIAAQEHLEDWGRYAVPHLVAILRDADTRGESAIRDAAVYFLRLGALTPLRDPFSKNQTTEQSAENHRIEAANGEIRRLRYALDAPESEKRPVIEGWKRWYEAHAPQFRYGLGAKVRILFTDTRFARYVKNLARLDFGVSLVSREPVMRTLFAKLKYSLTLSVGSLVLAYLLAIPLGIFSAVRKDTLDDRVVTVLLFMMYSVPSFFVATVLLHFVSEGSDFRSLRLFPTGGFESRYAGELTTLGQFADIAWHLALPMFCLTYGSLAAISRYMRSGLLDAIRADYVRTARAKGLPERIVIGKHALRNGLLPILTLLAGLLPAVLGGSVIIEYIFGIQGMGLWVVDSIYQRDYNVILAVELLSAILVLVGILLTDLSYAIVDPRIRFE